MQEQEAVALRVTDLGHQELGVVERGVMVGVEDQAWTTGSVVIEGVDVEGADRAVLVRREKVINRDLARDTRVEESGQCVDEHRRIEVDVVGEDLVQVCRVHGRHSHVRGNPSASLGTPAHRRTSDAR